MLPKKAANTVKCIFQTIWKNRTAITQAIHIQHRKQDKRVDKQNRRGCGGGNDFSANQKNVIIYNDFNSICTVLNTVALSVLCECGNLSLSHLLMCYNCSISLWKTTFEHFENEFPPVLRNIYIKAALLFF